MTPIELRKDFFDNLVGQFTVIKNAVYNGEDIESDKLLPITDSLNKIFEDKQCVQVIYTNNTDKLFFGFNISPTITNTDLLNILLGDQDMELDRFQVEIDSKAVNILTPDELAAYVVEEISNTMGVTAINNLRAYIDELIMSQDDSIDIRNSINYNALLTFAIKDTLRKLTSINYKLNNVDIIGKNRYANTFDTHDTLIVLSEKLRSVIGDSEAIHDKKEMSELQWAFMVYKDLGIEYKDAIDTLTTAAQLSGSVLVKSEIDKTIKALRRASTEMLTESAYIMEEVLNEKKLSMFKSIKLNGLRGIEDQLYEYKVRIRTCETEEDALYILRCINANLAIMEDYIMNTPNLSDAERERWQADIDEYRRLRYELGRKNFKKFNYGFSIDYSQFDKLDANRNTNTLGSYDYNM
jgi:hypothetical protein